jgi:hypothetical protein
MSDYIKQLEDRCNQLEQKVEKLLIWHDEKDKILNQRNGRLVIIYNNYDPYLFSLVHNSTIFNIRIIKSIFSILKLGTENYINCNYMNGGKVVYRVILKFKKDEYSLELHTNVSSWNFTYETADKLKDVILKYITSRLNRLKNRYTIEELEKIYDEYDKPTIVTKENLNYCYIHQLLGIAYEYGLHQKT